MKLYQIYVVFVVTVSTIQAQVITSRCINDKRYQGTTIPNEAHQTTAEQACRGFFGGSLPFPKSKEENDLLIRFAANLLSTTNFWLGFEANSNTDDLENPLSYGIKENDFGGERATFPWDDAGKGEPSGRGEKVFYDTKSAAWTTGRSETSDVAYVCEIPCRTRAPTRSPVTKSPTTPPTNFPSLQPTSSPTISTLKPTISPSTSPTVTDESSQILFFSSSGEFIAAIIGAVCVLSITLWISKGRVLREKHVNSNRVIPSLLREQNQAWDFDCFLSHSWGKSPDFQTHHQVLEIATLLKEEGFRVWVDDAELKATVSDAICIGIDGSASFVAFITRSYLQSAGDRDNNAGKEFNYSIKNGVNNIIPVLLDKDFCNPNSWKGNVGLHLGNALYIDFTTEEKMKVNFEKLCERIKELSRRERPILMYNAAASL